ncbi:MAG: hypothetical protein ACXVVQ_05225 [Solirubrobacteraceae bacterium]
MQPSLEITGQPMGGDRARIGTKHGVKGRSEANPDAAEAAMRAHLSHVAEALRRAQPA